MLCKQPTRATLLPFPSLDATYFLATRGMPMCPLLSMLCHAARGEQRAGHAACALTGAPHARRISGNRDLRDGVWPLLAALMPRAAKLEVMPLR